MKEQTENIYRIFNDFVQRMQEKLVIVAAFTVRKTIIIQVLATLSLYYGVNDRL